jgi:hypothetical protein
MNETLTKVKSYKDVPLLYIAGKLNDQAVGYLQNVRSLMELAEEARTSGFGYFCPAIDLLMGITFGYKDYHDYFDNGQIVLLHCDGVLVNKNWKTSTGTKAEIALAEKNGIPVFYSIKEAVEWRMEKDLIKASYVGG